MEIMPSGSIQSRIMVVQECPGEMELQRHSPLEGSAGQEFNRMLQDADLLRTDCFLTCLLRERVPRNDPTQWIALKKNQITPALSPFHHLHVDPRFLKWVDFLFREIDLVQPACILALGNASLFALTGKWGIKSWRGSSLQITTPGGHSCTVVPTYSPDYVLAVWKERQVVVSDMRRCKAISERGNAVVPEYNFLVRPSFTQTVSVLNDLLSRVASGPTRLSVDIETRGGHIACTGIAWSRVDAICIPQMVSSLLSGTNHYWREEEESFITFLLYRLLTHENAEVIGQNFLYDAQYFYRWFHFIPRLKRDTMIAHHSLFSNMQKGLDFLSSIYAEEHVYWKDESKNWAPKVGEEQLWTYNCKDAVITFEVDETEQAAVDTAEGRIREIHDFQQDLFWPVLETMIRGVRVDLEARSRLAGELLEEIQKREAYILHVVGRPLNPKSPKQMTDFFYRELAQRPVISRKTGSPTCDSDALERIGQREPLLLPLLQAIDELRSLGVFLSTFVNAPLDTDNRMRTSYNIAGTETYRFSSSENAFGTGMNMQNIPSGDEESLDHIQLPNIRKIFVPDPGMMFFDIDLDSSDLRIVVWESDCLEMKQMFAEGLKPYVEIAKEYYRDPTITKAHPRYKTFKAFAHASNYLGTPNGIASRIGLPVNEVDRIQKWYFGKFPEIGAWQSRVKTQLQSDRFVENIFGYRWNVLDRIEGNIFNRAVAWIGQSTTGCVINRGYKNLYDNQRDRIEVLLQVHDSLGGQYPATFREGPDVIRRECSIILPYSDPMTIPVGIKTSPISWGHAG